MDPSSPTVSAPPAAPAWLDRVSRIRELLSGRAVAVAVGLCGAAVAGVVVLLLLRTPAGPAPQLTLPRAADAIPPSTSATPGAGGAPAVATVHAAGAVAKPGVYAVPTSARVADVLAAAGGPLPEADLDRLNLAAKVGDGDRVTVPRKGDPVTPGTPAGPDGPGGEAAGAAGGAGGAANGPAGPIDLNSATADQLDTLPGVGPATAQAIITYRTRHGRFRSVTELLEVPGIGPTKMEALRPLVRV